MFRTTTKVGLGIERKLRKLSWRSGSLAMSVLLVLLCSFPALATPEKPYAIGGKVFVSGKQLTARDLDYTITLEVNGKELVSYKMGDYPVDYYTLSVPMDTDSTISNKGFPGDDAYIYVNGTAVDENPITLGGYGGSTWLSINANTAVTVPDTTGKSETDTRAGVEWIGPTFWLTRLLPGNEGTLSLKAMWSGCLQHLELRFENKKDQNEENIIGEVGLCLEQVQGRI